MQSKACVLPFALDGGLAVIHSLKRFLYLWLMYVHVRFMGMYMHGCLRVGAHVCKRMWKP